MRPGSLIHACLCLSFCLPCAVSAREDVTSIKPLLLQAISQGRAEGHLIGKDAEMMAKVFHSDQPVLVDVVRVHVHKQLGCARLQVTTRQGGVQEFNHQHQTLPPADKVFAYQIDYCESGRFPEGEGDKE